MTACTPAAAGRHGARALVQARQRRHGQRRQRGFVMVAAVFIVVVLALLGGMIVQLSSANQVGQARDLLGTRAYFAARAGIEWGIYRAMQAGSCAASSSLPALGGSAAGFAVTVSCEASGPFDEAGRSMTVYRIASTAARGTPGALDRAERELVAIVSTP